MEGDAPGANAGENGFDGKFLRLDGAGVLANGAEGMGVRAGDKRLAVFFGPTRGAKIRIDPAGEPIDMKHAPFDGIDEVHVFVDGAAKAGGMRIKGVRGKNQDFGFAGTQRANLGPSGIAREVVGRDVEDDNMAVVDFGFHAGNQKNASFAGIDVGLGIGANFFVPSDGYGVEPHFLGAINVLDEVMS